MRQIQTKDRVLEGRDMDHLQPLTLRVPEVHKESMPMSGVGRALAAELGDESLRSVYLLAVMRRVEVTLGNVGAVGCKVIA